MGISAIRVGGSFASVTGWPDGGGGTPPSTISGQYYQWQKWTGPPWLRPSVAAVWNAYYGNAYSLIGGWGPFEVIDMANALDIEPILTTTASSSAAELADLVEYCHGDAATTRFGRQRAADGHPKPYRVRFFELGNEQYNTRFVEQVQAMEARAVTLGLNGVLQAVLVTCNTTSMAHTAHIVPSRICRCHVRSRFSLPRAMSRAHYRAYVVRRHVHLHLS